MLPILTFGTKSFSIKWTHRRSYSAKDNRWQWNHCLSFCCPMLNFSKFLNSKIFSTDIHIIIVKQNAKFLPSLWRHLKPAEHRAKFLFKTNKISKDFIEFSFWLNFISIELMRPAFCTIKIFFTWSVMVWAILVRRLAYLDFED